ncbi:MAG: histidine ammonia-lyase [Planctomycetes bacterium]|nr:histidine ammonia-lyase [Planctomycetota bacterium]
MVNLGTGCPDLPTWIDLTRADSRATVDAPTRERVRRSRAVVEKAIEDGATVYGVNTGFGKLANLSIDAARLADLQRNLIVSHATGVGSPLPYEVARLALALRIHAVARGSSGVREQLVDHMLAVFNAGLAPVIPAQGSVGASGDLAPLAHMALPMIGLGEMWTADGRRVPGAEALRIAGTEPIVLAAKEGLALINGTQIMTAGGLVTLHRALQCSKAADIACAMTIEALRASVRPMLPAVHEVRPHPTQQQTAANIRALLADSEILQSHVGCSKVQDAYSMRCAPQVHGASKRAIEHARDVLLIEASSVTDNPLVFADGDVVSAGNFHGQPVSQALDFLAIGTATLANISERRTENLVNPDISGLPAFLAAEPGLESGFMIAQVTAAALASENKTLAHPASVDTVPTSANREDHVSMGVTAARHAAKVVSNTVSVLSVELCAAARGLDLGESLRPGRGVEAAYRAIRAVVPPHDGDRELHVDLAAAGRTIRDGDLVAAVESAIGPLAHGQPAS